MHLIQYTTRTLWEARGIEPAWDGQGVATELLEGMIDAWTYWTVFPSFNVILEERLVVQRQVDPLSVVQKLLKLEV